MLGTSRHWLGPFPLETDFLPFPEQPITAEPLLPGCCNKTTCPPVKEGIVSTWATPSRVGRAEPAEEKPSLPGGGFSVPGLNQAAGVAAIKETTPRAPQTECDCSLNYSSLFTPVSPMRLKAHQGQGLSQSLFVPSNYALAE